ncbi:TerD family protein [Exiguobacterium artemiae]|uniref:TerD family protein n=1 Tax=Exiguobacterium artemiae TaxID=340145 RepID=UPI002963FE92|nr:TerD family protein [Exiguobacterium sibiricum]MDW2884627.1 TerD family protein [Exiguobacterium sibiricum]
MSINLIKGQKIDLTKGNSNLKNLTVGLGWDPIQQQTKGFLSKILGSSNDEIDCDATVFMLDVNGQIKKSEDVIYFGKLKSDCNSVVHTGDNLTGEGDGDDEQILISLNKIPSNIHRLLFVVNIYDCINRNQHFGMIKNAYIRIEDSTNKKELLKFNLSSNFNGLTSLIAGEIYRHNNEWKFNAIGDGTHDTSINEISKRFIY